MFQIIIIIILIGIIIYLILDKKNVKFDDVKSLIKSLNNSIKEKSKNLFNKFKDFSNITIEKMNINQEKRKQQKAEQKLKQEIDKREENFNNNINNQKENNSENSFKGETESKMTQNNPTKTVEKVKVVKKGGFFSTLLCLILIICAGLFAYKKIMLDFDGKYATDRVIYTDEYGFCTLITYYPSYQKGNAKGIAVTHIPFGALFTEKVQANKYGNDTADSKDMLDAYQLLATWADNDLVDSLTKSLLSDSGMSTKSFNIGNHGKYFIINAKDMGYENPYY